MEFPLLTGSGLAGLIRGAPDSSFGVMDTISTRGPTANWQEALSQGKLLLQRDPRTGEVLFPPRPLGDSQLEWIEACGEGEIYSVTTISRKPPAAPHHVALVDLREGARLMGALEWHGEGEPAIGSRVRAYVVDHEGAPGVAFRPV